ncbi:HAD-IA family hydrolase [Shimia sp.]|jgi:phosphoglycolate phosphatase|uniref:HAD-IA family hydrolase n=1 Tax=unclassified Shimia TaxID=2630038 RepID=UPI0025F7B4CB|nr:HAD-IA family hydrolase [Shimia sp.]MCH2067462.1 HAD-IA family hydrolase [Shimia sp.]
MRLKLVIFDVDGTLVDSQGLIVEAMNLAFDGEGLAPPSREDTLSIVGLSLDMAMFKLLPEADAALRVRLVDGYKQGYMHRRAETGVAQSSPFFAGARDVLERLRAQDDVLLGVATGKSRRGLDKLIEGHGLQGMFVTTQVADDHPSKPHPSMITTALAETGVDARDALMIGDTSYDMEMAAAAGVAGIGVGWGYHARDALGAAHRIVEDFAALENALTQIWEGQP